jgi:hypothetical protein
LRIAVVSPFVDRRHGTERALAELLERLACLYHCEIHLYAQSVENLVTHSSATPQRVESGAIVWHKVPSVRGPHLLQFVFWLFSNAMCRWSDRYLRGLYFDVAIYQETLTPNSAASELTRRGWNYPVENFLGASNYERWPFGYGIGTTALGTQYVTRFFRAKPPVAGVESGFGTLVVEMGIVGLVLWVVMGGAIVFSAWRVVKKLRGSIWFPIAFVVFWCVFILLFPFTFSGIQPYEDFLLNAYLWLLLGILFRLPDLALSAQVPVVASPGQIPRRWIR